MFGSTVRGTAVLALVLAGFAVSCGADPAASPAAGAQGSQSAADQSSAPQSPAAGTPAEPASTPTGPLPAPAASGGRVDPSNLPPEKVRDSFAGLQATLDDSCTPANCAYFLGRVYDELHRLERSMKADPKGPGHFPEPIALIAKLDKDLGGDRSFENLKKHQTLLIGTRDKINTWMQGHPDDYR